MNVLTEEQKKRMEENRKKALERRAASKAKQLASLQQNHVNSDNSANLPSKDPPLNYFEQKKSISYSAGSNHSNQCSSKVIVPSSVTTVERSGSHESLPLRQTGATSNNFKQLSTNNFKQPLSNTFQESSTSDKNPSFYSKIQPSSHQTIAPSVNQVKGNFALLTRNRFIADVGYYLKAIEIFKTIPSRAYDAISKRWNFAIEDHDLLVNRLKPLQPDFLFSPLPRTLINLFKQPIFCKQDTLYDLSCLDPVLLDALLPFQKEGVKFGIQRGGRVLIADDMGLGKTIEAIGIANYFKNDWPLLVVMPSSVRYSWAESFRKWLPSFASEVSIIDTGKDSVSEGQIVLISYDLLTKKKDEILKRNFKCAIMDESHFLKNPQSARTVAAQHIMKNMKRIIMLSGTPALSRPIELFPQISVLFSCEFFSYLNFGIRYCKGRKAAWGWNFSESSNMDEFNLLLKETVMLRRLKSEVMKELPSKIRQVIIFDAVRVASKNKMMSEMSRKMASESLKGMQRQGLLLQYFHETGMLKLPLICDYIKDCLETNKKFICFAHHQHVMNGICDAIEAVKVDYIRIDGTTSAEQRRILCEKFQERDKCRAAILSITAANSGITLTAAQFVIFAELFWNPGILTQAEDRAHRIGQEDSVWVQYLVAKGTADDEIWPLLQRKLDILNDAGLSKDNFKNMQTVTSETSVQKCIDDFWNSTEDIDFFNSIDLDVPAKRQKMP